MGLKGEPLKFEAIALLTPAKKLLQADEVCTTGGKENFRAIMTEVVLCHFSHKLISWVIDIVLRDSLSLKLFGHWLLQ